MPPDDSGRRRLTSRCPTSTSPAHLPCAEQRPPTPGNWLSPAWSSPPSVGRPSNALSLQLRPAQHQPISSNRLAGVGRPPLPRRACLDTTSSPSDDGRPAAESSRVCPNPGLARKARLSELQASHRPGRHTPALDEWAAAAAALPGQPASAAAPPSLPARAPCGQADRLLSWETTAVAWRVRDCHGYVQAPRPPPSSLAATLTSACACPAPRRRGHARPPQAPASLRPTPTGPGRPRPDRARVRSADGR